MHRIMGTPMILFCEECGRKNLLEKAELLRLQDGFHCIHCGYTTPLSSIVHHTANPKQQTTVAAATIDWHPRHIHFGPVDRDAKHTRTVTFTSEGSQDFKPQYMINQELIHDLSVVKTGPLTFQVILNRDMGSNGKIYQSNYHGTALRFFDPDNGFDCNITMEFVREDHLLSGLPSHIKLGVLYSGVVHHDYLCVVNCSDTSLILHFKPDPEDFTIGARFVIENSHVTRLDPGEQKKIPYTLWPEENVTKDWLFNQTVRVKVIQGDNREVRRTVRLIGKVLAPLA